MAGLSRALRTRVAAPRAQPYQLAAGDAEVARHLRVDLDERLGLGLDQRRHAPGLGARLVVRQHAGRSSGRAGYSSSGSSAGGRCWTAWKRARPSGVAKRSRNSRGVPGWSSVRAGPEDAVLGGDRCVADAGVVGDAAGARPAQLVEKVARARR